MDETPERTSWVGKYGALCALAVVTIALTPVIGWWRALIAGFATLAVWAVLAAIVDRATGKIGPALEPPSSAPAPDNTQKPPQDHPELALAIAARHADKHADVLILAAPYLDSDVTGLRADALRLTALAHSQLSDYAQAVPCWERLVEIDDDSHTWLNVATSLVMVGAFDRADEAFERMQQRYVIEQGALEGSCPIQPMAVANYLQALDMAGRPDLAIPHLETLAGLYRSLGITDSNFLFTRKMPFFSTFLERSLPILRKVIEESELATWYRPIHQDVDDDGKALFARLEIPH